MLFRALRAQGLGLLGRPQGFEGFGLRAQGL